MKKSSLPQTSEQPQHGGLLLRHYVAIVAATAEGFELPVVLEHEGLLASLWSTGEPAWVRALADSVAGDMILMDRYDQAYQAQRQLFRRAIEPLDEDLQAWLALFQRWVHTENDRTLLEPLGLDSSDVQRLQQAWSRKMSAQPELGLVFAKALAAPPLDIPPLTVANKQLPAPVATPVTGTRPTEIHELPTPEVPDNRTAPLITELPDWE